MRNLAAAVIAAAMKDLLQGHDADGVLSWVNASPARIPFSMACGWLDISPQETRLRLQRIATNPAAYRESMRLVAFRTAIENALRWPSDAA